MSMLDRLADTLVTKQHALWFGAGVSVPAGIPTVKPLRTRILKGLRLSEADVTPVEQAQIPFEALFEVLLSISDCSALFEVFRGENPALGHLLSAQLSKRGLVRTILTTNFDTLVEDALSAQGLAFDVYASDEAIAGIDWLLSKVRVIKLHGSIENVDELAVTIRMVAARHRADARSMVIRQIFEHEAEGGIVILGYSCSDHFDVSPAARSCSRLDRQVLYVAHDESGIVAMAPLRESHPGNPFQGFAAQSVTCATEDLLKATWRALLTDEPPPSPVMSTSWKAIVDSWLHTFDEGGVGRRTYVAGLVLKAANLWERSNERLCTAISKGLPDDTVSRALLAIGNNRRDLGQFDEARQALIEAEPIAHQLDQVDIKARILNSLGIVAEDLGNHDRAIDLYEQALPLARRAADRELEGKCNGNLGIALKNRNADGDLKIAVEHHNLALDIALEIGDKRSEGRTLGNIGLVYRALGDLATACRYYAKARAVAESLGDLLHIGIWLHNEGEDTANEDPITASALLQRSKDIFLALGQIKFAQESGEILEQIATQLED